jgi:hypothetical protein
MADGVHGGDVVGSEHVWEEGLFFESDAVFAGDAAAHGDAEAEDFCGGGFGAFEGAGFASIVHDEGVEVAVAGMEDIGDAELVAAGDFADAAEGFAEAAAWDDAILDDEVRAEAADGGEGAFAAFPDAESFVF